MKGIVLAGGKGTRLYPMTQVVSKQLLPIYDKPMIYYPLSVLLLAEIKEILIISTPSDLPIYQRLLGDGSRFGVEFSYQVQEKPAKPKSNFAVPGLYFYDNKVVSIAKNIEPSNRGELEITAVNNVYLERGELRVSLMGRGMAWLDTGTPEGMLKASEYVEAVQSRQGFYISCLEEIAWRRGFITVNQLRQIGEELKMTDYGKYLLSLANGI